MLVCEPWNIKVIKHVKDIPCCLLCCNMPHCTPCLGASTEDSGRMLRSQWKLWGKTKKQNINMLTTTRPPVIQQSESRFAVALSSCLGLVGALVVVLRVRAELGTASVVNWAWCQLWRQGSRVITVAMRGNEFEHSCEGTLRWLNRWNNNSKWDHFKIIFDTINSEQDDLHSRRSLISAWS